MENVVLVFFFLRRGNKARLALFPLRKRKNKNDIFHEKLRVPTSEREVLLLQVPRAGHARATRGPRAGHARILRFGFPPEVLGS